MVPLWFAPTPPLLFRTPEAHSYLSLSPPIPPPHLLQVALYDNPSLVATNIDSALGQRLSPDQLHRFNETSAVSFMRLRDSSHTIVIPPLSRVPQLDASARAALADFPGVIVACEPNALLMLNSVFGWDFEPQPRFQASFFTFSSEWSIYEAFRDMPDLLLNTFATPVVSSSGRNVPSPLHTAQVVAGQNIVSSWVMDIPNGPRIFYNPFAPTTATLRLTIAVMASHLIPGLFSLPSSPSIPSAFPSHHPPPLPLPPSRSHKQPTARSS